MPTDLSQKLIIAISSRALFDMSESNRVFEEEGLQSYALYQNQHEQDILEPGPAFPFVQKLTHLAEKNQLVEVVLLSRNSADTGLRIFNSIEHYGLNMTRAAFTSGRDPYQYVQAFDTHLFLSACPEDVRSALQAGCTAATLLPQSVHPEGSEELRIAFDGDAVLFSDEAERIYQEKGLDAFSKTEKESANSPLRDGPFKRFLSALDRLQNQFTSEECPIRTALVTARQAPAHERVIKTLRSWNIRIDEAFFLGGLDKTSFLKAFRADIFFDDQATYCEKASEHVTTAHVPHGIVNEPQSIDELITRSSRKE